MPFEKPPTPIAGALGQADEGQAVALLLRGHVDARQPDVEGQHLGRAQPRLVAEELGQVADAGARGRVGRRAARAASPRPRRGGPGRGAS